MSFSWEFNPVSLIAIIGGVFAVIKFWFRSEDKINTALRTANESQSAANDAKATALKAQESVQILQSAMSAYKETQAERLVSREVLRDVEDRLAQSIERLGDRLDTLVTTILKGRHDDGRVG